MKGSEKRLVEYMEGSNRRFIIPVYQRNYDWKIENCKQLYDDLVDVIRQKRRSHFFGSIVSVYHPSGRNLEFLVIDGQQRLTTVSLLLLAMYNLINSGIIAPAEESLGKQIYENFLVDKYQPKETRIKLKPVKNDQSAFGKLFESESEFIYGSNLTANYKYFYDRIQRREITVDELFDAIHYLEIIDIILTDGDNPQLIFESLNSTGLDLTEGDKIRNYILMGLSSELQEDYYERYWNRIEVFTKYDVSAFIRDYLSVKQQSIPAQKNIYAKFKEYVKLNSFEPEALLKELLEYAKRYSILLGAKTNSKELNACIYRLNRLETTVTRPFFLEVLRLFDKDILNINRVAEIFLTTENYLFRRTICDLPTNSLNKIFLTLHKDVMRYDNTAENYAEKYKFALLSKKERARFPDDEEFAAMFAERQIYLMNSKNKVYILERLENFGTAEDKDIYAHCDEGEYSIEHIMPQHLTPEWIQELGDDYEYIHETWLHRIANLTLTAYNSEYSNHSFDDKKNTAHGFIDSGIRLNTYIAKNDKWTLNEIEERSEHLTNRALKIWEMPSTLYFPAETQPDSLTLDDDDLVKNRSIVKFSYKNTEQPVTSWVDMYQKVLRMLFEQDSTILMRLAAGGEDSLSAHFSVNSNDFSKSTEISEGLYVWTNTNTQSKCSVLKRLFQLYGNDNSDLVFYLKDDTSGNTEDEKARYATRRKYWAFALPLIQQSTEGKVFKNVSPSKENWINGYFGVSGFNIVCVANNYSVRTELYFGKSDTVKNKEMFKKVYLHKEEIEAKTGEPLCWDSRDEVKSSKIYFQTDGVSIDNESDWPMMAEFHAKWSKAFNDIIVPYIISKQ